MSGRYILISPVYNEAAHLPVLISSIAKQTVRPVVWLLVNDGSRDQTEEIIRHYMKEHKFIELLNLDRKHVESYYSRKTQAFIKGYEEVRSKVEHDFVASLDADIIAPPSYYQSILQEFEKNPRLGIAGGIYYYETVGRRDNILIDQSCVPGSVQMFRRECYEEIGGYIALKRGGDDTLASIMARMKGWETRSFPEYAVMQRRKVGTVGGKSILSARFGQGLTEYEVATHPIFMIAKSFRRCFLEKPYVIGSCMRLIGFACGYLMREPRRMPAEAVRFVRREQIGRLLRIHSLLHGSPASKGANSHVQTRNRER